MAVDLRDELFQTVRSWEDCLRQLLRHRAARDLATREDTLVSATRYLNRNFDKIMAADCATDFGREVNVLFSTALNLVKNGPLRSHISIPCPWCNRRTLLQQEGLANVPWFTSCEERLGGCGRLFTETEMVWTAHQRIAVAR